MGDILCVNPDTSSLSLALYSLSDDEVQLRAEVVAQGIEEDKGELITYNSHSEEVDHALVEMASHDTALTAALKTLNMAHPLEDIDAVGIRIRHGSPESPQHQVLTQKAIKDILTQNEIDPAYHTSLLRVLKQLHKTLPPMPFIGCFDTALFSDLPEATQTLALPHTTHDPAFRRYGADGIALESIFGDFAIRDGQAAANGRVVVVYLDTTVNVSIFHDQKPIDTSVALSASSSSITAYASGALDPTVNLYLYRKYGLDAEQIYTMLTTQSGLLAVSGFTGDIGTLLTKQHSNKRAKLALEIYYNEIAKLIASLGVGTQGIDSIIFSGTIGEKFAEVRAQICRRLEYVGAQLDSNLNAFSARLISSSESKIGLHVISTKVNQTIAVIAADIYKKELT